MSPVNLAKIFEGDRTAYAPCTSEAVMHIMNHYGIELQGKKSDRHRKKHGCWKTAFHADAWTECNCNYLPFTHKRSGGQMSRSRDNSSCDRTGKPYHRRYDCRRSGGSGCRNQRTGRRNPLWRCGLRKCPGKSIPYHTGSGRSRKRHNLCTRLSRAACRPYRSERTRTTQRVTPPLCRTQYKWVKNSYSR